MSHVFAIGYLGVAATFFLVCGGFAAAKPGKFAATLDLEPTSPGGANEIRAQYGGVFVILGIICALAAFGVVERQFALGSSGVVFGGVIAGRLFGLGLDRSVSGYGTTVRRLILIDAAGCMLAIAAMLADRAAN